MTSNTKLMIELDAEESKQLHEAQWLWQHIADELDAAGYLTDEYEELFDSMDEKFRELCDLLDNGFEKEEENGD